MGCSIRAPIDCWRLSTSEGKPTRGVVLQQPDHQDVPLHRVQAVPTASEQVLIYERYTAEVGISLKV